MKMLRRGERGFTLIELLIVVAILGVLAAVIIPNVGQFLGRGKTEAQRTEFHNVAAAVTAMMVDNDLSAIPIPTAYTLDGIAYKDMAYVDDTTDRGFPDFSTTATAKGGPTSGADPGYVLYQHHKITATDNYTSVSYVNTPQTQYYYTAESDGLVRQWADATTNAGDELSSS